MALSGTTNKVSFNPSVGETTLVFDIPFFDATTIVAGTTNKFGDIKVTRLRDGIETALVPVSGVPTANQFKLTATNGDPAQGGTVTIAASTAGDKFTVERDVAYTQEYDLQEGATIDPTALNKAFDRAVAQNQQQNDLFTRTVQFPVTDDAARTYTVGTETDRANKALGFDNNGNVTQINIATEGGFAANADAGLSLTDGQLSAKVDNVTTQFSGGNIVVKQVDTAQIAADAITTSKIEDGTITLADLATATVTSIRSALYPVGAIFTSVSHSTASAVNTALGFGTWVAFGAGRVMVGHGTSDQSFTAGATGGNSTHTLTVSEMPSHTHRPANGDTGSQTGPIGSDTGFSGQDNFTEFIAATNLIEETGGGNAHDNLQPYVVVYMWRRTA